MQEGRGEERRRGLNNQIRRRILLVDDELDTCLVYQMVLQDAGYECNSYTESVKALQEFRVNYYEKGRCKNCGDQIGDDSNSTEFCSEQCEVEYQLEHK
jgi:hypothetical protein